MRDPVASQTFHLLTDASARDVWAVLTAPERTAMWFRGLTLRSSWAPGAVVRFEAPGGPALTGRVLAVTEEQELSYTVDDASGSATYLSWTLRPAGDGCVVRLTVHETVDGPGASDELEDAWLPVLDALRRTLAAISHR
jgi:uncharacterized protein YndB with AHSA1/START domain